MDDADQRPDERAGRPESALIDAEQQQRLEHCLGRLAVDQAEVVRGRLGGESYEDLSAHLNVTVERTHSLFHKAKAQLQVCVGQEER